MAGSEGGGNRTASAMMLAAGLGVIYLVWGSTYLATNVAVARIPPFLLAGSRFLVAGLILYVWMRGRGAPRPSAMHWRMAAVSGGLMLIGGNGLVVWAQQFIPSNVTALLITTTPLWMALFDWLRPGGVRPPRAIWLGSTIGFAGMAVMAASAKGIDGTAIRGLGVAAVIGASISWALGSVFAKHAPRPASPVMMSAMQMLAGGAVLMTLSATSGELRAFDPGAVTGPALLSYLYLTIVGSLLTMSVYAWLLQVTEPNLIATYAFVNPVIAVILGWLLLGEALTGTMLLGGAIIVGAVAWLIAVQWRHALGRIRLPRRRPRTVRLVEEAAS